MKPPIPRNIYSPSRPVITPAGEGKAQQQFKDDCDVNKIMQRFQKTRAIDHVAQHQPQYGFATPLSYHESLNIITTADSMFNDLPSSVRNEFKNSAALFLEFVQDPKNSDRAEELGIALSPQAADQAAKLRDAARTSAESQPDGEGTPSADEEGK